MTQPLPKYYAEKQNIIKTLFVDTADDNYILARFCFHANLDVDFFWLAVHCLEKYLKATLLLNGKSSKSYKHNIVKLYDDVRLLAPELLSEKLTRPEGMPPNLWRDEATKAFIGRLYRDGQAHNRYQLYGYVRRAEDLWKLDEVVFNVRRLCQPLEAHFLFKQRDGVPNESKRQRMTKNKGSWKLYGKLEETIAGKRGETLQRVLLEWNRPFAPDDYIAPPMSYRSSASNPVLVSRLLEPLDGGSQNFADADELWKWVHANIELPKELIKAIQDERDMRKARHSAAFAAPVG